MKKINREISVIMPAYNCEDTITRAINSVLNQSFENFELIVVDDGSTDNTYKICESIVDERLVLIHQKNQGPSIARNHGIEVANGKYLMFIDSDDEYYSNALELLYYNMAKENSEIVVGNFKLNDKVNNIKNEFIGGDKSENIDFLFNNNLFNTNWNKIYSLEIINKNNIRFDKNYKIGEDARFNLKYFEYVNNIIFVNKVIYQYYFTTKGLTLSNDDMKCSREVELLEYEYEYFKNQKLNMDTIFKKIHSTFFYFNNPDFLSKNKKYFDLLKKSKRKSLSSWIIYLTVCTRSKLIIKILLNLKGSKI